MSSIILVGYMGCGKTTVGRCIVDLAKKYTFADTDALIVAQQGRSINDIFETEGEPAFRAMETALLEKLLADKSDGLVLATGGGMPVRAENRRLLRQLGTVIYLRVMPKTVYSRIRHDTTRPLLQCDDPMGRIREMMENRDPAYEEAADTVLDVDSLGPREAAGEILRIVDRDGGKQMKLLVINGPNLNFLGIREKGIYGTQDYEYLMNMIQEKAKKEDCEIVCFQSNHEGAIIDRIQEAYFDGTDGIVINPGAYTHYSYAIRDALASITVPKVEIHISDITKREEFRKISVTKPACDYQIYGKGLEGYLMAIDFVLQKNREM